MEEAEPIGADAPTIAAQLAAQKELNEEILLQRARAKDAVANAKKILRETAAGEWREREGRERESERARITKSMMLSKRGALGSFKKGLFYSIIG